MTGRRLLSVTLMFMIMMSAFLFYQEVAEAQSIDYIVILDGPSGTGNEIPDQAVSYGFTVWGYAAGYNTSSGFVQEVVAAMLSGMAWNPPQDPMCR